MIIFAGFFLFLLFCCGCDSTPESVQEKEIIDPVSEKFGAPRCPRCFKFLKNDEIKILNQHTRRCLKCNRTGSIQQFYKRKK